MLTYTFVVTHNERIRTIQQLYSYGVMCGRHSLAGVAICAGPALTSSEFDGRTAGVGLSYATIVLSPCSSIGWRRRRPAFPPHDVPHAHGASNDRLRRSPNDAVFYQHLWEGAITPDSDSYPWGRSACDTAAYIAETPIVTISNRFSTDSVNGV